MSYVNDYIMTCRQLPDSRGVRGTRWKARSVMLVVRILHSGKEYFVMFTGSVFLAAGLAAFK